MQIEYYQRISFGFSPGEQAIKDDWEISHMINAMIYDWANSKIHTPLGKPQTIRIVNVEHSKLPKPSFGPGNESVLLVVNLAYTV